MYYTLNAGEPIKRFAVTGVTDRPRNRNTNEEEEYTGTKRKLVIGETNCVLNFF